MSPIPQKRTDKKEKRRKGGPQMACALDLTGLVAKAAADAEITIKLIADQSKIQRASINRADISDEIDASGKSLTFSVPAGRNTLILVLLPPPSSEMMKLVEDCGGGKTQTILSFGAGIHASISFDIIAS
jgi:hypothetical protein